MQDITLKITGKQFESGEEESIMEFVTDGRLYERNGAVYVVYEESEVSGMKGCTTTIKLVGDTMKMKRIGDVGMNSELYFEKGFRFSNVYHTPYGPFDLEVLTKNVETDLDENHRGHVEVEYHISLHGLKEGKNRLSIDIM